MASVAGCTIRKEDASLVIASVACFASFFAYGAISSSLGAALPSLGKELQSGICFSLRGAGFFIGTIVSAATASDASFPLSKEYLTALCILLSGAVTGMMVLSSNYYLTLILYGIQGAGFGGIDTFANCALPELWGLRAQPWMQALHAFFGVGAIVGPAIVGGMGYRAAFVVIFFMSIVPILGLMIYNAFCKGRTETKRARDVHAKSAKRVTNGVENSDDNLSMTTNEEDDDDVEVIDFSVIPLDDESPSSDPPAHVLSVLPKALRLHITLFYLIYAGTEAAYAGWIPTFALRAGITSSVAQAAYLSSYFWFALTVGRVVAIPTAVYVSASGMYRFQAAFSLVSSIAMVCFVGSSYGAAVVISILMGFGLSSIYPLMMTLVADYGYAMDAGATSWFVAGACLGEGGVPVLSGWVMTTFGPAALSYFVISSQLMQIGSYLTIDYLGTHWGPGNVVKGTSGLGHGDGLHGSTGSAESTSPNGSVFNPLTLFSPTGTSTSYSILDYKDRDKDFDSHDGGDVDCGLMLGTLHAGSANGLDLSADSSDGVDIDASFVTIS